MEGRVGTTHKGANGPDDVVISRLILREVFGGPGMGPIFSGMLLSDKRTPSSCWVRVR